MQEDSFSKTIPSTSTSGFLDHIANYDINQKISNSKPESKQNSKTYGKIHVVCGPMFAQKRSYLLEKMRKDMALTKIRKVLIVTYEKDSQYYFDQMSKFWW